MDPKPAFFNALRMDPRVRHVSQTVVRLGEGHLYIAPSEDE
jgi:hypothetical protein